MKKSILIFFLSVSAASSENLTTVLAHAYKNNSEIRVAWHNLLSVHEKLRQAYGGFLPTVTGDGTASKTRTNTAGDQKDLIPEYGFSPAGSKLEGGITMKLNLFQGGANVASVKQADESIRRAWLELRIKEQEIFLAVIRVYVDLFAKEAEIRSMQANVVATKKSKEFAQSKEKIGEETRTQVATAEARLAEAEARLQQSLASYEALKATFVKLVGMPVPTKLDPVQSLNKIPKTLEEAVEKARDVNLRIIAAHVDFAISKINIDMQSAALLPTLGMFASSTHTSTESKYVYKHIPGFDIADSQTNNVIGLQLSVPLFDGGVTRSKYREAREASVARRVTIDQVLFAVLEALKTSWANYDSSKRNIDCYKRQVEAGKIRLEGTYQEMVAGTRLLLDVLNAQYELLNAEVSHIQAIRDSIYYEFEVMAAISLLTPKTLNLSVDSLDPTPHYEETRFRF